MAKVRYEEMFPPAIAKAREILPIAYVALGTIKWHGEHNAVGLDTLKTHALAQKRATVGGGLAFLFGMVKIGRVTCWKQRFVGERRLPGAMHYPQKILRLSEGSPHEQDIHYVELLLHICRQIKSLRFKVIVLLVGHYPLLRHAKAMEELMMLRERRVHVVAVSSYELVQDKIPDAGGHVGKWEASLLMVLRPECVDMKQLSGDPNEPLIGVSNDAWRVTEVCEQQGAELVVQRIMEKAKAGLLR